MRPQGEIPMWATAESGVKRNCGVRQGRIWRPSNCSLGPLVPWPLSFPLEGFELVEGAGPVGPQQARQAAVGQNLAAGLALGAVVGFVVGVANALDLLAAAGAGQV